MYKTIFLVAVAMCIVLFSDAQGSLIQSFENPPNSARPRVWWHWMNGNVTKNGIQKDLEWMERVGIGGFQNFDANLFTPQVVEQKLVFMTPEWQEAFKFATNLADEKGLEMAIAGSPGWSVTGGPWVPAEDGMKKYVWTETHVTGGITFRDQLPKPKSTTGKFQNVALRSATTLGEAAGEMPSYFKDQMVIAYRLSPSEKLLSDLSPQLTSSSGTFNLADLTDGDLNITTFLPPQAVGKDMWIQYSFDEPQTFKALSLVGAIHVALEDFNGGPLNRSLKVSDDGEHFREIARFTSSINPQNTIAFAPTTSRFWRLAIKTLPPPFNPWAAFAGGNAQAAESDGVNIAEFVLHNTDRIDQFEDKAGFTPWKEDNHTYLAPNADAVPINDVIELTSKMNAEGILEWEVPDGNWVILRFGYSLTGRQNHPASPEATGLEVDKMDAAAVQKYINIYLDMYKEATDSLMGSRGLQYMILDSYEAGHMTWTSSLPEEFAKRRGYQLDTWIPVLTGRVIKSRQASEQFLWDFRKTIGELIAENHYDVIGEELHKRGMKRYTESHEDRRIYLADGMDVKRNADIPMSAMWTPGSLASGPDEEVRSEADIRESASVANIYGKPIVAAESMTAIRNSFAYYPEKLKRTADLEMASGLNRFVIHTSVHQPLDDKMPGFSLGPFGQWFTRHETWAEQSRAWVDYLSRSCHLLQQGRAVKDVLYYYGENTNITWQFRERLPKFPGYEYDFVNASALRQDLHVLNNKITTSGGASYSLLVLDESAKKMTLATLKKLRDLVKAGASVTGTKPEQSPSLADDPMEFQKIINEIWSYPNASNKPAKEVLKALDVYEDVINENAKDKILFVHRFTPDTDIYWLNNRSAQSHVAEISFRIIGKVPELWNPQTGQTKKVSWQIKNGRTVIPLHFESWDAFFIVFNEKTSDTSFMLPKTKEKELSQISGPWQVSFQKNRGAPAIAVFTDLISWTENTNPGIKYFSGTATYQNTFKTRRRKKSNKLLLDLGEVKNIAEVIINGKNLGTLWKPPFKMDITDSVKKGKNQLEIKVSNLWVNRLIGDAQPETTDKITFTTMPFYQKDDVLLPSGLLSSVRVLSIEH